MTETRLTTRWFVLTAGLALGWGVITLEQIALSLPKSLPKAELIVAQLSPTPSTAPAAAPLTNSAKPAPTASGQSPARATPQTAGSPAGSLVSGSPSPRSATGPGSPPAQSTPVRSSQLPGSTQSPTTSPIAKPSAAGSPQSQPTPQPTPQSNPSPDQKTSQIATIGGWLVAILLPIGLISGGLYAVKRSPNRSPNRVSVPAWSGQQSPDQRRADQPAADLVDASETDALRTDSPVLDQRTPETQTASIAQATPVVGEPLSISPTTRLTKVDPVTALIADLHSSDSTKRQKAIWQLGQQGDSRAVQPLTDLLVDLDSQQRSLVLGAIAEIGARTIQPMNRALLISLQDDSPEVRKNAIRDITRVYDLMNQISHLLHYAASDTDSEVQETARWALSQLSRVRSLPENEQAAHLSERLPLEKTDPYPEETS